MGRILDLLHVAYNRWLRPDPLADLMARGLVVGTDFHMLEGVSIDWSHCWHITIGDSVTLAPRVQIFAHDASTKNALGYTRIGKTVIGDRVFVGAASIILPGVRIGSDVIVGAGSVVTRDIPDGTIVAGNPARPIGSTRDWLERRQHEMDASPRFGTEYTFAGGVTAEMKDEMNARMSDGVGYIT